MRLVRLTRTTKDGSDERLGAVNPALVRHVYERTAGGGTYIAFEDEHTPDRPDVVPIGTPVAESFDVVVRRLNRAYYVDLTLRFGGFLLAAIAAVIAM